MIKKITFLLLIASTAQAGNEYVLPTGYSFGLHPRNDIQELIELKSNNGIDSIKYVTMAPGVSEDDVEIWLTSCSRRMVKGIPETLCEVIKDNFLISVSGQKTYPYLIYFDNKTMNSLANSKNPNFKLIERETNYKIDASSTITLPMIGLSGNYNSNVLVREAKKGNILYYSIKNNEKYQSYKLNLTGFKESMDFAEAFISANK
ncbi:TPA: hypothetical protein MW179_000517 [Acinetobacter baumannii]|uniref:hypothetical protein n=1 Tax=Acinetobacter pittii TaxID=48296 RepID=UPI0024DE2498|nr:hypothetical protein [Acinetobacter pittii]HCC8380805.1 hypothetical protein [Acinetobacter baumannii]